LHAVLLLGLLAVRLLKRADLLLELVELGVDFGRRLASGCGTR
jgi:hypothetical protein